MGEHRGPERGRIMARRLLTAAFQPGKEFDIGRPHLRPNQFDLVRLFVAECGDGSLGKTRGDANAQSASHQLEQRPTACLVQLIEPTRELSGQLRLAEGGEGGDNRRQQQLTMLWGISASRSFLRARGRDVAWLRRSTGSRARDPHERDGLGEIADIIVRQFEQYRIDPFGN